MGCCPRVSRHIFNRGRSRQELTSNLTAVPTTISLDEVASSFLKHCSRPNAPLIHIIYMMIHLYHLPSLLSSMYKYQGSMDNQALLANPSSSRTQSVPLNTQMPCAMEDAIYQGPGVPCLPSAPFLGVGSPEKHTMKSKNPSRFARCSPSQKRKKKVHQRKCRIEECKLYDPGRKGTEIR